MKYLTLGNSELQVSQVCLGTMTWGQQNDQQQAHAQLDLAVDRGVNFFDTAEMYPVPASPDTQGATESILGKWLKGKLRDRYVIATKVIGRSDMKWIRGGGRLDDVHIRTALEASLKRMGTDYVDLYQIHWPDRYVPKFGQLHFDENLYVPGTPILETLEVLAALKQEGKIRQYGLSNETAYGVSQFLKYADRYNLPKPVTVQNAYNLINRVFEIALAENAFHERIHLLAYSPLAFGFLSGKYLNGALPDGSRVARFPSFAKRYLDKVSQEEAIQAYAALAGDYGLVKMALQFLKSRPFCPSVIIGATNLHQLRENLDALEGELPSNLLAGIEGIHRRYPNPCP